MYVKLWLPTTKEGEDDKLEQPKPTPVQNTSLSPDFTDKYN